MISKLALAAFIAAGSCGAADLLLVVHKTGNSLGMYEPATGKKVAEVPVGLKPHEMALTTDKRFAVVTNYGQDTYTTDEPGGNTLTVVDLVERKAVADIDLGDHRRPHGIERAQTGHFYVTTDFPPSLLEVDAAARTVVRAIALPGNRPHMVQLSLDEKLAFTADAGSGTVTVVDLAAGKALQQIPTGGIPMGFALTRDGKILYVTTRSAQAVCVIDVANREVIHRIEVAGDPARLVLTADGSQLLVSLIGSGDVAVIDTASGKEVRRMNVGLRPEGMMLEPGGKFGYVSAQGDDKVIRFSMPEFIPASKISTSGRPDPLILWSGPGNN